MIDSATDPRFRPQSGVHLPSRRAGIEFAILFPRLLEPGTASVGESQNILPSLRQFLGDVRGDRKPEVLVSAPAVGYYGDRGDEELDGALAAVLAAPQRTAA